MRERESRVRATPGSPDSEPHSAAPCCGLCFAGQSKTPVQYVSRRVSLIRLALETKQPKQGGAPFDMCLL